MAHENNIENLSKKNQFKVPTHYFEELPQNISLKKTKLKNGAMLSNNIYYKILTPSMVVLTLLFSYYVYQTPNQQELNNQQLSETLLNDDWIEFDEELIYEVYAEAITNLNKKPNEEIIDYLINDNISINLIIEEL